MLDVEEINDIVLRAGQIPQHGIKYIPGTNTVVLTSNSMGDLSEIFDVRQGWNHSARPARVAAGWMVIVIPNGHLRRTEKPGELFGVSFTALEPASPETEAQRLWFSERNVRG